MCVLATGVSGNCLTDIQLASLACQFKMIMIISLCAIGVNMLTTGNQLKAARVLAEIEQIELATVSGISVSTIRAMEGQGGAILKSGLATISRVQKALEARGVEFLNHGQPGVRLSAAPPSYTGGAIDAAEPDAERRPTHGSGRKGSPVQDGKLTRRALLAKIEKK